jgi:hypothetical protein
MKIPLLEFKVDVKEANVKSKNEWEHTCVQFMCPFSHMMLREATGRLHHVLVLKYQYQVKLT